MDRKDHWESIYTNKSTQAVSWYQSEATLSLELIAHAGLKQNDAIIDVGGGASVLVDHLLHHGYTNITVLDISSRAIQHVQERLADKSTQVHWVSTDVTEFDAPQQYRLWHDRAVFHFLTDKDEQQKYVEILKNSTHPEAQVIIAAFAIGGPEKCSGLNIVQYDAAKLSKVLGDTFKLLEERTEQHITPSGQIQQFGYYRFSKA